MRALPPRVVFGIIALQRIVEDVVSNCFYFVFTQPKVGREDEFNHWYSSRHIYDRIAILGVVAAQRYRLLDAVSALETIDYLAIYEFDDVDLAVAGIAERRGTDRMPFTEAINLDLSRGVVFKPLWVVQDSWRFGRGRLDLFKLGASLDPAALQSALGVFLVDEKQSRPGPPVFDLAYFHKDECSPVPLHRAASVSLSVLMLPITDRIAASA